MKQNALRITEIFYSLQGESTTVGLPTIFLRLTGCPLRCQYCDTAYAFSGGQLWSMDTIFEKMAGFDCARVCVTGGEPLAQPGCYTLLEKLCDKGYQVSLETSGARDIAPVDSRVMIVMDLKTPDSKEVEKNLWDNIPHLKPEDQIKFVLCSRKDYEWAREIIEKRKLSSLTQILFSPSYNELDPTSLAEWILEDRLPVRFQIQLHKILWKDTPGR